MTPLDSEHDADECDDTAPKSASPVEAQPDFAALREAVIAAFPKTIARLAE